MPSYRENVKRHRRKQAIEGKINEALREQANKFHEKELALLAQNRELQTKLSIESLELAERERQMEVVKRELAVSAQERREMLLWCPACGERHIDDGEFATKPHHTHACQHCGMVWRPAIAPTVGVMYLPGFKNDPRAEVLALVERLRELRTDVAVVGHDNKAATIIDQIISLAKRTNQG